MGEDEHRERNDGGEPGRDERPSRLPDGVEDGLFPAEALVELFERASIDMDGEVDAHADEHREDEGGEDVQPAIGDRDDAEGPGLADEERGHDDRDGAQVAEEEHEQREHQHHGECSCGRSVVRDLLHLRVPAVGAHNEGPHLRMERLWVQLVDGLLAALEDLLGVGGVGAAALHAGGEYGHLAAARDHVVTILLGQFAQRGGRRLALGVRIGLRLCERRTAGLGCGGTGRAFQLSDGLVEGHDALVNLRVGHAEFGEGETIDPGEGVAPVDLFDGLGSAGAVIFLFEVDEERVLLCELLADHALQVALDAAEVLHGEEEERMFEQELAVLLVLDGLGCVPILEFGGECVDEGERLERVR